MSTKTKVQDQLGNSFKSVSFMEKTILSSTQLCTSET